MSEMIARDKGIDGKNFSSAKSYLMS